jgi:hypothetical protein
MESGTSFNQAPRQGSRASSSPWGSRHNLVEDARSAAVRPHRGIGALATGIRDLLRDTVYVTVDALRGRYDR